MWKYHQNQTQEKISADQGCYTGCFFTVRILTTCDTLWEQSEESHFQRKKLSEKDRFDIHPLSPKTWISGIQPTSSINTLVCVPLVCMSLNHLLSRTSSDKMAVGGLLYLIICYNQQHHPRSCSLRNLSLPPYVPDFVAPWVVQWSICQGGEDTLG